MILKTSIRKGLPMRLIPREEKFFDLFEELVDKIAEGCRYFLDLLEDYHQVQQKSARLKRIENEADDITHRTYEKIHTTFLTPLDREDIHCLVNKLDSIMDMMESASARMMLYKIREPIPEVLDQALILNEAIAKIKEMIPALRNMKNSKTILKCCVDVKTLENDGDIVMRTAMANLFDREKDPFNLIKWKEILERVEESIDVCDDVANLVEGIVLKNG
jgi:hypothetical protein